MLGGFLVGFEDDVRLWDFRMVYIMERCVGLVL